jgi:hypothetical protein
MSYGLLMEKELLRKLILASAERVEAGQAETTP